MRQELTSVLIALVMGAASSFRIAAAQVPSALSQMTSSVDSMRVAGFYAVLRIANRGSPEGGSLRPHAERLAAYARQHSEVAPALIALLARENKRASSASGPVPRGEDFSDYYGDLVGCVAALKDRRALSALLEVITTGDMATQGLAALGEPAAAPVLERARASDPTMRQSALITLREMTAPGGPSLGQATVAAIRNQLLGGLKDPNRFVRSSALEGAANFRDAEVADAIAEVAKSDSFSVIRDGRLAYPLREEAKAYMARANSAGKPSP
jgi:hypothetical protein